MTMLWGKQDYSSSLIAEKTASERLWINREYAGEATELDCKLSSASHWAPGPLRTVFSTSYWVNPTFKKIITTKYKKKF